MNIYLSGSLAYDRIMDFPGRFSDYILPDKIHILNVCFNVNGLVEKFGGTAGNIAYSLSLLNETPHIIATIGRDYHNYFEWLQQNNIPVDGITIIREEVTAGAYITTDLADNQITGFNPGAMKYASAYTFDGSTGENAICLIAPGNLDDMTGYAKICREKGIPYICDPGQSLSKWAGTQMKEWLRGSMALISNDYELEVIIKMTGLDRTALLSFTGMIITTLGENGSLIRRSDGELRIPPVETGKVVDPTGAGDAYRAGMLKGIITGRDIETSGKMGSVAAVYAVEAYGTQEHGYTYENFLERYRENFGEL